MTAPTLPITEIRQAVNDADWDTAHALLEQHEAALRASFDGASEAESRCRESWLELLAAQRSMIEELRTARDEAARVLERMGRDRRGMSAYLQGG